MADSKFIFWRATCRIGVTFSKIKSYKTCRIKNITKLSYFTFDYFAFKQQNRE